MEREELLKSREYWLTKIQFDLFKMIDDYKTEHNVNQTDIAEMLGVTKGYVSQILKGDYDHRISKMVDLSLALGKAPTIEFKDLEEYIQEDACNFLEISQAYSDLKITSINSYITINEGNRKSNYSGEERIAV